MAPPMDAFSLNDDQSATSEPMANFAEVVKIDESQAPPNTF